MSEKLKEHIEKGNGLLKLEESNISLWDITISLSKSYKKKSFDPNNGFALEDAVSDFNLYCGEFEVFEEDIDGELDENEWFISCGDISFYLCDCGDGSNMVNDLVTMMKDEGINPDELWDGQFVWNKIIEDGEVLDDDNIEKYLKMGLQSINLKFIDGYLVGEEETLTFYKK